MKNAPGRKTFVKVSAIVLVLVVVGVVWFSADSFKVTASALGPSPSFTNAPGESNCTQCHSDFPVNSGTGSVAISGIPANYLPNQQIPVTVTTSEPNGTSYGFQLTALDSLGHRAGTLSIGTVNPGEVQIVLGDVGGERQYLEHTDPGTLPTVFGSKTWQGIWTAPPQRIGKIGFYAAGNGADGSGSPSGDHIYTTSTATLSGSAISNFDNDTASELAVFRPSTGAWYSYNLSTGAVQGALFGLPGDRITPGDYDGDGKTDLAVFRPSTGVWYVQRSSLGFTAVQFGQSGDLPVPGDYDGDLKTDFAVFRPSTGAWYLYQSTAGIGASIFGQSGDKPAQGDYDADGKTDIAVFRPSTGVWYVLQSRAGFTISFFGSSGDLPVQADYDGDGKTDVAVYRPSTGAWYLQRSTAGIFATVFGLSTDIPAPADFDGDGKADVAVFRGSTGVWYAIRSSTSVFFASAFGTSGDVPVPAGYLAE